MPLYERRGIGHQVSAELGYATPGAFAVHFDGPFYFGIGFCSHQPVTVDAAVFSNVTLENAAEKVR